MSSDLTPEQTVERERKKTARKATLERNRLEALKRFEALPDQAFIRVPTLAAVTGYSVPSCWRLSGTVLPRPRKLSAKVTGWIVGEVRETLKRIASAA